MSFLNEFMIVEMIIMGIIFSVKVASIISTINIWVPVVEKMRRRITTTIKHNVVFLLFWNNFMKERKNLYKWSGAQYVDGYVQRSMQKFLYSSELRNPPTVNIK